MILDGLRTDCDHDQASGWTVAIDATMVRAHHHAAGARRKPPADIPTDRLTPTRLSNPVNSSGPSKRHDGR